MKMNYLEPPTKNKKRQQRRRQKYRSLQAKALHEGRNGPFRHRVFDSNRSVRSNSSSLIKEYLNETQEEWYTEIQQIDQKINDEEDPLSSSTGDGEFSSGLVDCQRKERDKE